MKLTCPECSTSYAAAPAALGDAGRKVKCHKCAHVWFATPQDAFAAQEADELVDSSGTAAEPVPSDENDMDAFDVMSASGEDDDGFDASADDDLLSSDEAEADATWDSVLEDVGLAGPADEDDLAFVDVRASEDADADDAVLDIETLAAQRNRGAQPASAVGAAPQTRSRASFTLPAFALATPSLSVAGLVVILGLAATSAFLLREQVVSLVPGTARLYAAIGYPVNLRGFDFENVTFVKAIENGVPVLAVSGEIVNVGEEQRPVPHIRFALRNELAQEIYHWTGRADAGELGPAGRARFLTRLAAPPVAAREIQVRFAGKARVSDGPSP